MANYPYERKHNNCHTSESLQFQIWNSSFKQLNTCHSTNVGYDIPKPARIPFKRCKNGFVELPSSRGSEFDLSKVRSLRDSLDPSIVWRSPQRRPPRLMVAVLYVLDVVLRQQDVHQMCSLYQHWGKKFQYLVERSRRQRLHSSTTYGSIALLWILVMIRSQKLWEGPVLCRWYFKVQCIQDTVNTGDRHHNSWWCFFLLWWNMFPATCSHSFKHVNKTLWGGCINIYSLGSAWVQLTGSGHEFVTAHIVLSFPLKFCWHILFNTNQITRGDSCSFPLMKYKKTQFLCDDTTQFHW